MRLKLSITNINPQTIPINYQYPLMSSILQLLKLASRKYSDFVHNEGYKGIDGKYRKLFTFSKIYFSPSPAVKDRFLFLKPKTLGLLYISSPMIDDFLKNLIIGASIHKQLFIDSASFVIQTIEIVPQPDITNNTYYRTLSPLVLTTVREHNGKQSQYYYRPTDNGIEKAVQKSLIGKFQSIYSKDPEDDTIEFSVDSAYIERRGGERFVSKLIRIKENQKGQTNVKAFECPFYLSGSAELVQVAWDCGIGDRTHQGFGCIDVGQYGIAVQQQ